jgi:hypothetical protein
MNILPPIVDREVTASEVPLALETLLTVVLQWCYSGVTVVLQWCYSGVTVVLQSQREVTASEASWQSKHSLKEGDNSVTAV